MDIYVPVASKRTHGTKTPKLREEPPFDFMIEEEKRRLHFITYNAQIRMCIWSNARYKGIRKT